MNHLRTLAAGLTAMALAAVAGVSAARAQSTFNLRAVPSATTLTVGQPFTLDFVLDVPVVVPGDNYTAIAGFLQYARNGAGGGLPPSPFVAAPSLTNFASTPGAAGPGGSGFVNATLANPDVTISGAAEDFRGLSFRLNAGTTPRTDTSVASGGFLLSRASAAFAAPGVYTFDFRDVSGLARTFITGTFGGAALQAPPQVSAALVFTTNEVTFNVVAIPEPGTLALLVAPGATLLGVLVSVLVRKKREE